MKDARNTNALLIDLSGIAYGNSKGLVMFGNTIRKLCDKRSDTCLQLLDQAISSSFCCQSFPESAALVSRLLFWS